MREVKTMIKVTHDFRRPKLRRQQGQLVNGQKRFTLGRYGRITRTCSGGYPGKKNSTDLDQA